LVTTTRPVASSTAVRSVNVPPTSIPTMNLARMIHYAVDTRARPRTR
jgi:hypothetical protein